MTYYVNPFQKNKFYLIINDDNAKEILDRVDFTKYNIKKSTKK